MPARTVDAVMLARRTAAFMSRSIKTGSQETGHRLALSMLDLTTLEGADTDEKVRAVCRKAITPHPPHAGHDPDPIDPPLPSAAAVCVYPALVPVAREALAGSTVRVASVATGFPSGQFPFVVRLADVGRALEAGAEEIDMVMNRGAFLARPAGRRAPT
jgi:deoxyribose-phosphate aldolase